MRIKKSLCFMLTFIMIFSMVSTAFAGELTPKTNLGKVNLNKSVVNNVKSLDAQAVEQGLKNKDEVRVIVEMHEKPVIEHATNKGVKVTQLNPNEVKSIESDIQREQSAVLKSIEKENINADVIKSFKNAVNGFSITTTLEEAMKIEDIPDVKKVSIVHKFDRPRLMPNMTQSAMLTKSIQVWKDLGYNGEGMTVAIIDTGIDPSHKDFNLTNPENATMTEEYINNKVSEENLLGKYYTAKVPYGYNYMDNNNEILDKGAEASMHGMHVAGTVAANATDGKGIKGVAPEAQVLALKVFGNDPGFPSTFGDTIIAAIDDAIILGADVMNLSLGATAAYVDRNDPEQMAVTRAVENGIVMSISAGNSGFIGSGHGNPLPQNPDIGVVGSPGITAESLQVASVDNMTELFENSFVVDGMDNFKGYGKDDWYEAFAGEEITLTKIGGDNLGGPDSDCYDDIDVKDKVVLVYRGAHSFYDKTETAAKNGAKAIIVYTHGNGALYKNQGGWSIPFALIEKAPGLKLQELLEDGDITIQVPESSSSYDPNSGKLSSFSSWGTTPNLDFKPDVAAPGGNIYSTLNNDQYGFMSGTSMAAPHAAGGAALVLQRVNEEWPTLEGKDKVNMAKALLMNTAKPQEGNYAYTSPRKQGAGSMNLINAVNTPVIVTAKDTGLAKVNLREINDTSKFTLIATNYSDKAVSYELDMTVQTDLIHGGENLVESQNILNATTEMFIDGEIINGAVEIPANDSVEIAINLDLSEAIDWHYEVSLEELMENGAFVEGYVFFNLVDEEKLGAKEEAKAELTDAKNAVTAQEKVVQDATGVYDDATTALNELKVEMTTLEEQIAQKEEELANSSEQVKAAQEARAAAEEAKVAYEDLKAELLEKETLLAEKESAKTNAEQAIVELTTKIETIKNDLISIQDDLKNKEETLATKIADRDELKAAIDEAIEAYDAAKSALKNAKDRLEVVSSDYERASDSLTEKEIELDNMRSNEEIQSDIDAAKAPFDEKSNEVTTKESAIQTAREELSSKTAAYDELSNTITSIESEIKELASRIEELEAKETLTEEETTELNNKKALKESKETEINEKQQALENIDNEIKALKEQLEVLNAELTTLQSELSALQSTLNGYEEEMNKRTSLKNEINELDGKVKSLFQERKNLTDSLDQLEKNLETAENTKVSIENEKQPLVDQLNGEIDALNAEISTIKESIEVKEASKAKAVNEKSTNGSLVESLITEITSLTGAIETLTETVAKAENAYNLAETAAVESEAQVTEEEKAAVKALQTELASLKAQLQNNKSKQSDAKKLVDDTKATLDEVTLALENLKKVRDEKQLAYDQAVSSHVSHLPLSIPYMGFYGEWDDASIFDETNYEESGQYYGYTVMLDDEYSFLGITGEDENGNPIFDENAIAFSPDGNGTKDSVQPLISFLRNAKDLSFEILNDKDEVVKTVYKMDSVRKNYFDNDYGNGKYTLNDSWNWDGTINNEVASEGSYKYRVTGTIDFDGAEEQELIFPVVLDNTKPIIENTEYENGAKELTVVANDKNGSGINDYVLIELTGTEDGDFEILQRSDDNVFDLTELDPEVKIVTVAAIDNAGNISIFEDVKIINDASHPEIDMRSPKAYSVQSERIVNAFGTVEEATIPYVWINGEEMDMMSLFGSHMFMKDIEYETDGYKTIDIRTKDEAGNEIEYERHFYVDATDPTIKVTNDVPEFVENDVTEITIEALIEDNFPELEVRLNGDYIAGKSADFVAYKDNLEPVAYDFSETVSLDEGDNLFEISATDAAGTEVTKQIKVYREYSEAKMFDISKAEFNGDKVSTNRPLSIDLEATKSVNWKIEIVNSKGEITETITFDDQKTVDAEWAPEETKKLNGEYTVNVKASNDVIEKTTTHVFDVYNYSLKVNKINTFERAGQLVIETSVENLEETQMQPLVVVQVKDADGIVSHLSAVEGGVLGNNLSKMSSGFEKPEDGDYTVEIFVWSDWETPIGLAETDQTVITVD